MPEIVSETSVRRDFCFERHSRCEVPAEVLDLAEHILRRDRPELLLPIAGKKAVEVKAVWGQKAKPDE